MMVAPVTTSPGLRSMTGQGHARREGEAGVVEVEIRTVNHRGFKAVLRLGDSLAWLEGRLEKRIRGSIRRGSVHVAVHWRPPPGEARPAVDTAALQRYYRELEQVRQAVGGPATIELTSLLQLPGVMLETQQLASDHERLWALVCRAVDDALDELHRMRGAEGEAMASALTQECETIRGQLDGIRGLVPRAAENYRQRLEAKIERLLKGRGFEPSAPDLYRELQIFADRCDVSEEVTRLESHLEMFHGILQQRDEGDPDPAGRKLDFVTQEMFREANTIGSKAADAEISSRVVEIKCGIERMRELVQNVE